jgi:cytochrome c oxidase subunit 2
VPKLGIKRDAIPGFMHEAWARIEKPGTYRGQCTELCGVYHGFMPIVVHAVPEDEFNRWIASQQKQPTPETRHLSRQALMTLGKEKYEAVCAACHQPNGRGIPPLYPALKGSSVAVGHPIVRHIDLILNGVEGSAMQPYRDQLNDEEIAAIVTYERNAWENNTDEEVQPDEVAAARQQNQQPVRIKTAQKGGIQ